MKELIWFDCFSFPQHRQQSIQKCFDWLRQRKAGLVAFSSFINTNQQSTINEIKKLLISFDLVDLLNWLCWLKERAAQPQQQSNSIHQPPKQIKNKTFYFCFDWLMKWSCCCVGCWMASLHCSLRLVCLFVFFFLAEPLPRQRP